MPSLHRPQPKTAEDRFEAMGSRCHVMVTGPVSGICDPATATSSVAALERMWSRFIDTSDIGRLNAAGGSSVAVEPQTILLATRSLSAMRHTNGAFNPFVGAALANLGYDRPFDQLDKPAKKVVAQPHQCSNALVIDRHRSTLALSHDAQFDPGGIGKGLAADLVLATLMGRGAKGAMVNLGGDVRVAGIAPSGDSWGIELDPLGPPAQRFTLAIKSGAVATSSTLRRRWTATGSEGDQSEVHHIVSPSTGDARRGNVVTATVVAGAGWFAEIVATALVGRNVGVTGPAGTSALLFDDAGGLHHLGRISDYLR